MTLFETYLCNLHEIYLSQAGVKETSYYGTLETLLNEIGKTLKPKVRCIINLRNQGAGLPDGGLFSANQFRKNADDEPFKIIFPERGVIEIKGTKEDVKKIADSEQVQKYWQKYGQILVTNYRDFLLLGKDHQGNRIELEQYSLAATETEFWKKTANSRQFAQEHEERFTEYLKRVMLQTASISSPSDVAWFLASYARDAKSRLEQQAHLSALSNIRKALEDALGIKFQNEQGSRFFRSTLVQTLFYGIFSAWVLWHKENPNRQDQFDWKTAAYYLHVPMLSALFEQIAAPSKLKALGLVEVLNWTGSALNRVRRDEFFNTFDEGQAVQYFYEPFLQAFDPELRKDLGVWYTPPEIVKYMVSRVDTVLREELEIEDGLANPNVYILDPCCGTGAYLVEVLRHIANTLEEKGEGALAMSEVKQAAIKRVFGFEILTAPFVVAHLQLGLCLQALGVPLVEETERVGVYLTNALTGWQPSNEEAKKTIQQLELTFPELNKEREAADEVKQGKPILVILGNPPYNAFAGTSPVEEDGLVEAYKKGLISEWGIKKFNLDDLYVRFFRLAERCISENTGKGVVCYISNFSYLSDPSYVVMRQIFLSEFDQLWFDSMNGDSRETGKLTPEGKPDPSVFSTQYNKEGIRVGTAIGLMVRKEKRNEKPNVYFRHFWGINKRQELLDSLNVKEFSNDYKIAIPDFINRYTFRPSDVEADYLAWPKLTDLSEILPFNGPVERRGFALISIEKEVLASRLYSYFDKSISDNEIRAIYASLMMTGNRIIGSEARQKILNEFQYNEKCIVKYPFKPFDIRWCYLENIRPLFSEPSPNLLEQRITKNSFFVTRDTADKSFEGIPFYFSSLVCDYDCISGHSRHFPILVKSVIKNSDVTQKESLFNTEEFSQTTQKANLSEKSRNYLNQLKITNFDTDVKEAELIWMNALAIGYSPLYLTENADGIRQDFPRIPLPKTQELLLESATLGQQIASLLDTENSVSGVTTKLRAELKVIAVISRMGGGNLNPDHGDLKITAGWGHGGKNGVTMPGKGKIIEREYTPEELNAFEQGSSDLGMTLEDVINLLGKTTCDIYLNDIAYWKNIPIRVWKYTIGGYQVIKKWLSYREEKLLGRSLKTEEVKEVSQMTRRIAAIVLLESQLDQNYLEVKKLSYDWNKK
ncbi:DNA methyltransferase [Aphanothece hegewaldii CCALA 016]|uniref:site-specific DNA-methyltransferase (adenine-specific) n=1 Tax=Aphanothece hegewaldii CCALA 016 TaxID=2107694 RepID=A0A2T1LTU9_9CHRO|nr:type ISP restriction/modification enzyme [Aphanothece hegewaldii]PSF34546.1 DNA methyltransferase [Aphanothece hegewaldii CCALA 016]